MVVQQYIPAKYHYPSFRIWATSSELQWKKLEQLLYWYPDKNKQLNQVIIGQDHDLDISLLPLQSRDLLSDTKYTTIFN
jgi:hypothetical protein